MQEQEDQDNAAYVRRVHDRGLRFDRRRLLAAFGGAGALALVGGTAACSSTDGTASTSQSTGASVSGTVTEVESETAGPFPANGSNGPDVRIGPGVVRRDIRSSFGDLSGTAEGVPLEFSWS